MFVSFRILHGKTLLLIHEIINYCLVRNISSSVYGNFGNGNSRWFMSESYWADCIGNFKFISSPLNAKSFSDKVFPPAVNCTRISADRKSSGKLNWIQFASLPTKMFNESVWFGNGLPRRFIRKSKKLFFSGFPVHHKFTLHRTLSLLLPFVMHIECSFLFPLTKRW